VEEVGGEGGEGEKERGRGLRRGRGKESEKPVGKERGKMQRPKWRVGKGIGRRGGEK